MSALNKKVNVFWLAAIALSVVGIIKLKDADPPSRTTITPSTSVRPSSRAGFDLSIEGMYASYFNVSCNREQTTLYCTWTNLTKNEENLGDIFRINFYLGDVKVDSGSVYASIDGHGKATTQTPSVAKFDRVVIRSMR